MTEDTVTLTASEYAIIDLALDIANKRLDENTKTMREAARTMQEQYNTIRDLEEQVRALQRTVKTHKESAEFWRKAWTEQKTQVTDDRVTKAFMELLKDPKLGDTVE